MKSNLLSVMLSFLKIGTVGFGGGSALIPVVEKELVQNKKWITHEKFNTLTVIANITPGALPVKLGALWNSKLSVISAFCIALPGVVMLLILLTAFSLIGENAIKYVEFASVGISSFIILLLYSYVVKVQKSGLQSGMGKKYLVIMLLSLLLTFGKELRLITAIVFKLDYSAMRTPFFDLSTIDLMLASFFLICFIGSSKSKIKLVSGALVAGLFGVSKGKMGLLQAYSPYISGLMAIMVIASIAYDMVMAKEVNEKISMDFRYLKTILIFSLIAVILSVCVLTMGTKAVDPSVSVLGFIKNILISSFASFGGGEAYVSVADGFFVQTGYVEPQIFYNQIVASANALPGPILVKVGAAVGFVFGKEAGGIGFGWMLAILGMVLTVGASSISAVIVLMCFKRLANSPRLQLIKAYILPVVCGMLISTIMSVLYEALQILVGSCGINSFIGIAILTALFLGMKLLYEKLKINDVLILLISGGSTLLLLSLCF